MPVRSELHEAALEYAAAGMPVFPCVPNGKEPATPRGFKDATTDVGQIDAWWYTMPTANIAFSPHTVGLGVIDPDGEEGIANWEALAAEHGGPIPTYTVRTPRGGLHLYFKGELPASQSKLGPHIDTRGVGSYALLPPSIAYGKPYELIDERPTAPLPDWVLPLIRVRKTVEAAPDVELDQPWMIASAVDLLKAYVKRGHVAVEGEMGDSRTFAVAAELGDLGCSPEKTQELLLQYWNPHCIPPWDEDELWVKVENANRNRQVGAGAYAVPPASSLLDEEVLGTLASSEPEPEGPPQLRFRAWTETELAERPPPEWLLPDFMPERGLGLIFGPYSSYKTFLALDRAATVAKTRPVVWLAGEGGSDITPRLKAWRAINDFHAPLQFRVVEDMPMAADQGDVILLIKELVEQGVRADLVVIDTAATMMVGMDENSAKDAGQFVQAMKFISKQMGAAVLAIHHTGKDTDRGTRGSNAIPAGVDSAFEVKADTDMMTASLTVTKQRSAKKRSLPWTYEGREMAGSLAFSEISHGDYNRLTLPDDLVSRDKVKAALGSLGEAARFPQSVSTQVLATAMHHGAEDEHSDDRAAAIGRLAKALRIAGTKGKLESVYAFSDPTGRDLIWYA